MAFTQFLFKNLDHFKKKFFLIFVAGIINGALIFFIPVLLAQFIKQEFSFVSLKQLFVSLILVYGAGLVVQWCIRNYGEALASKFSTHLREKYFHLFQKLSIEKLQERHSGYRISLLDRVAESSASLIFRIFWILSHSISGIILFFYFTAQESFFLAVYNIVILSFFIGVSLFFSKKIATIASELNKTKAAFIEKYIDFMSNLITIKKLGIQSFANKKIGEHVEKNQNKIAHLQRYHAKRWFVLHMIYGIAFLSTIFFFLYQIAEQKISPAVLILFIAAFAIIRWQIEALSEYVKDLMQISQYITSLEEVAQEKQVYGDKNLHDWKTLHCEGISYFYKKRKYPVKMPNINLTKGEKIAIIGKSGVGKTTALNILSNWIQPQQGNCFIDRIPYKEIAPEFFTKRIAFVAQETELFNMSLEENITLGKNMRKEKMLQLLRELDLKSLLEKINNNLQVKIGEKGIRLSSGEKQRINLLRAILLDKEIYFLDEPTAHLDAHTEENVVRFLQKYLTRKTVIIVTHKLALKNICDRVYEMS